MASLILPSRENALHAAPPWRINIAYAGDGGLEEGRAAYGSAGAAPLSTASKRALNDGRI